MSRKARNLRELQRRKPQRSPYDRVLIVCEGGKTEPNYFQALIDDLRLNTANVEVDGGSGSSPRSVVAYAKDRLKQDRRRNGEHDCFDRVYCVFDQDEHPTFTEALEAIRAATPRDVFYAITSIPCFEFWLLLHFELTTRPIARSGQRSPGDNAIHELRRHLPKYEKGHKDTYHQVKRYTNVAIKNAEKVKEAATKTGSDNPSTLVHELVDFLHNLGQ